MSANKDILYNNRYQKMLACQKDGKPMTMRFLEELWGLASTSAVEHCLKKMEGRGMVGAVKKGKYRKYYAVEAVEDVEVKNDNGN